MGFRQDINGLRAIAVLMVPSLHSNVPDFDAGFIGRRDILERPVWGEY